MCKEVEDYAKEQAEKLAKERETLKAIKIVNKLLAKGESLKSVLEFVEIDKATFNECKDKI